MIYGVIPVGGVGSRLGLSFPKELLPLKGYGKYYPVVRLTTDSMESAGCEKLVFVHGDNFKEGLRSYFNKPNHIHINNPSDMFSRSITCLQDHFNFENEDVILYGLPDSVYDINTFPAMVNVPGVVCGLYKTKDESKVDRLNIVTNLFDVKSPKTPENSEWFWGTIKMDGRDIRNYISYQDKHQEREVGNVINHIGFKVCYGGDYLDLGTWPCLDQYWGCNL